MSTPEEPGQEAPESAEHVKPVAWAAVSSPSRPRSKWRTSLGGPRGFLGKIVGPAVRYPRVTIEAVLTAGSIALGLFFLPTSGAAVAPTQPAIKFLQISRSANVPTYLIDRSADTAGPDNEVIIGMDVPATAKPVSWTLYIVYSDQDHIIDRNPVPEKGSGPINFGAVIPGSQFNTPGYQALQVTGTITPGSGSYSEFQSGFLQAVNQRGVVEGGQSEPTDVAKVDFVVSGPVPITVISGASMAVSLPAIYPTASDTPKGQGPAPFNAEMLYDAGPYQSQTGGPTILAGTNWDWFSRNAILDATTATGLDNGESRTEENDLFLAAVFFGLSAAAGAALAVELVEAIQEHGREKRAAAASSPSDH